MLLSIGIIAKNEEKYLEGCLESIKPLLDTGKAELVFVDTGSTDRTVEIAKKYTDTIHYFEWINDFSAARNETIKYSKGSWYMYIDADEAFKDESVLSILDFIESKESDGYSSASFHEYNFTNKTYTKYNEFIPTRIYRLTDDVIFKNKIHECISVDGKTKDLPVVLLHYGYANADNNKNKEKRNNEILLDYYSKNPKDPRILMYLHNGTVDDAESERYLTEWLNLVESNEDDYLDELCYISAARFYYSKGEYLKAIKYLDEFFSLDYIENRVSSVCGHFIKADTLFALKEYEKAYNAYKEYFKKMSEYQTGKLDTSQLGLLPGVLETDLESRKVVAVLCLLNLSEEKNTFKLLEKINWSVLQVEHYASVNEVFEKILSECKDAKKINKVLRPFANIEKEKSNDDYEQLINVIFWACNDITVFEQLIGDEQTLFTLMIDVLKQQGNSEYPFVLEAFVNNLPENSIAFSPVIGECLKNGVNISNYISLLSLDDLNKLVDLLQEKVADYKDVVLNYISSLEVSVISDLLFECLLLEKISSEDTDVAYTYSMTLANYVTNIFNDELLNDDDIKILEDKYQYGYYMFKYDQALNGDDLIGAIRYLGKAVRSNPNMVDLIETLLKDIKIDDKVN